MFFQAVNLSIHVYTLKRIQLLITNSTMTAYVCTYVCSKLHVTPIFKNIFDMFVSVSGEPTCRN